MRKITILILLIMLAAPGSVLAISEEEQAIPVAGASLFLKKNSTASSSGETIGIYTDPHGTNINAVSFSLNFNPQELNIKEIKTGESFCPFFVENNFENETGEARLGCLTPYGATTTSLVAEIVVERVISTSTTMSFGENAMALANDGKGTNVLATATSLLLE